MTVLVAYSPSAEGHAALAHGARIAGRESLSLVSFALETPHTTDDGTIAAPEVPADIDLSGIDVRWLGPDHQSPDASGDLLDAAEELKAELIVVGVRRRSRVGKLIMGSMAQKIIIGANAPVLAVKSDQHEH